VSNIETRTTLQIPGAWQRAEFWEDVAREIDEVDWTDLMTFVRADESPIEPNPGFEEELRREVLRFFLARYAQ